MKAPVTTLIVSLFALSAAFRLVDGAMSATASEALVQATRISFSPGEGDELAPPRRNPSDLAIELMHMRNEVQARKRDLDMREKDLEIIAVEIEGRLKTLEQAERRLTTLLNTADGIAEEDISRMTEMYSAMKPKQAAALFAEMEPDFAAGFLRRMQPDVGSQILGEMDASAAYTLSVVLAGQHRDLPPASTNHSVEN